MLKQPEPNRLRGLILMIGAGLCWSMGGLVVRSLTLQDAWAIVFWRSIFMALFVLVVLLVLHRRTVLTEVRGIGPAGCVAAL